MHGANQHTPRLEDLSQAIDQLQPEEKEEGGERGENKEARSPAAAVQTFFEMTWKTSLCTTECPHRPIRLFVRIGV